MHLKHEVLIFHTVQRKTELDFELENRPHELIDMETGQQIKVQPAKFKEKYQQSIREHFQNIELTAKKYGIDYTLADVDKEFSEVLLRYLIKRQRMR